MNREWRPIEPVRPGELLPCGSNPSGTHREFFAHPDDIPDLLENGIMIRECGTVERYRCSLTPTPRYGNGDMQIAAVMVDR